MINLDEVTKFDRTPAELEEFAIFSVLVAGKTAKTMVKCLHKLLGKCTEPFGYMRLFRFYDKDSVLVQNLKSCGVGCSTYKAKTLYQLVRADLDLKTCTTDDLEKIWGIAEKTSRFFILHTRPNQQLAALDRHILRYLRDNGIADVPTNTPKGHTYRKLEKEFLSLCQQQNKTPAQLDLEVWYKYSKYKE